MLRKVGLFFLSLWLLFLLIIIITVHIPICFGENCTYIGTWSLIKTNYVPFISIIALGIGLISYLDFKFIVKGSAELSFEIIEIENIDYEHLTFLATYIIPLVCFQFEEPRYQLVFWLILFVIGLIYVRTDLFYANPTLAILQFRLYKIKGLFRNKTVRESRILITRDILTVSDHVRYIKLDERIYFAILHLK